MRLFPQSCMEAALIDWIESDHIRLDALHVAARLNLDDWCLAAGFVRNLAWDHLHGYPAPTPLADIDLIYFDPSDTSAERDAQLQDELRAVSALPWSIKNQARMHVRNNDRPYLSTAEAMRYWVEVETAVGARLNGTTGKVALVAPFGIESLFAATITMNPKRRKPEVFAARLRSKGWLKTWPLLRVVGGASDMHGTPPAEPVG